MNIRFLAFCLLFGLGFLSLAWADSPMPGFVESYPDTLETYQLATENTSDNDLINNQLRTVGRAIQDRRFDVANDAIHSIKEDTLSPEQKNYLQLLIAQFNLQQNHTEFALAALNQITAVDKLQPTYKIAYYQSLAMADHNMNNPLASALDLIHLGSLLSPADTILNDHLIWQRLQEVNTTELNAYLHQDNNTLIQGWLALAYIQQYYQNDSLMLKNEEDEWQIDYPHHPATAFLLNPNSTISPNPPSAQTALILPSQGPLYLLGQAVKVGFVSAMNTSEPTLLPEEGNLSQTYQTAVSSGTQTIVGPLVKTDVSLVATLSPPPLTLALNTVPDLSPPPHFYQFGLSPEDEASQVALRAQNAGYQRVLIIAPKTAWGKTVTQAFSNTWTQNKGYVVDAFWYTNPQQIDAGLQTLLQTTPTHDVNHPYHHRSDADVIFLLADPVVGREIMPLLRFYNSDDLPVYATSYIYSGKPNVLLDKDLDGIEFCDMPFLLNPSQTNQSLLSHFIKQMPNALPNDYRLFALGADAYQLTQLLPDHLGKTVETGYPGLTGTLYLSDNQTIKRNLLWAQFREGVPHLLPE